MKLRSLKCALTGLQWTLGLVILVKAILFLLPSSGREFAQTHMPAAVRIVLGLSEAAGSILMLIPQTKARGAWFLAGVFVLAIAFHVVHGMYNVGDLAIYTAAAWAIAAGENWAPASGR
jgi:hypothetical protein